MLHLSNRSLSLPNWMLINGWLIPLLTGFLTSVHGQQPIRYTAAFTQLVEDHHLVFDLPDEGWYKVTARQNDDLADYNLILISQKEKMEIRYRWEPAPGWTENEFKMQFISMLSTLATNDEDAFMAFNQLGAYLAQDRYHATMAMIARFQPKYAVSPLPYARLLQIYHPQQGMITCLVFYRDKSKGELAQQRLQHLRFK